MRPFRFILLLAFFVALPVFLTCWSLLSAHDAAADRFRVGYSESTGRMRAFFSFSTPSSLFPPSALISVTGDNSTFFLARPAAFGPSLPSKGLNGELWVGRGFGEESILEEEEIYTAGWELGCSDVPGWREDERKRSEMVTAPTKPSKRSIEAAQDSQSSSNDEPAQDSPTDDGTDDYLHRPLSDSLPAKPGKQGEPANADNTRSNSPTHADIESLQEGADIAGKIVLLARGGCGFLEKVKWVQRRGGIALIVGDREKGASLTIMYAKGDTSNVTIPSIFTSWNAAHLLSSMVPAKGMADEVEEQKQSKSGSRAKAVFTATTSATDSTPTSDSTDEEDAQGWMHDTLAAIGLTESSWHQEDTRRPPGSGNIQWILSDNWDDDNNGDAQDAPEGRTFTRTTSKPTKAFTSATSGKTKAADAAAGADDFVIGVQDWRDTHLLEDKQTDAVAGKEAGQEKNPGIVSTSSKGPKATEGALKGGSITPGSGEYIDQSDERVKPRAKDDKIKPRTRKTGAHDHRGRRWFSWFRAKHDCTHSKKPSAASHMDSKTPSEQSKKKPDREGLWVTLTPTTVSASPFFDTLLVLVVSPLVTLTVVYALLMLRSRIRRRRWRAPKSLVDRLPVRTYHTMSTSSSTTSSQVASPVNSTVTSPLLVPITDVAGRPRPRSQTAGSVLPSPESARSISRSPPCEKAAKPAKRRKYTARQVECAVCLEDYIDGESQVMSLPCGHEFHAECITPWLVNRRRTCPICKGDVVRSMSRAEAGDAEDVEPSSDEVQNRIAHTVNDEPSSAIPIPVRDDSIEDEDVEQGQAVDDPLLEGPPVERQANWRNILASSLTRLSGDTVWRQTPSSDRSR